MKVVPNLFRITSLTIFLQLLLGGLLTFDFIGPIAHIITGLVVFILALATMVITIMSKAAFKTLRGLSIGMVALIVIQLVLGFESLATESEVLAWFHFAVAMGIYAMSAAGAVMASMWENRTRIQPIPQ